MLNRTACLLAATLLAGCSTYADKNIAALVPSGTPLGTQASHFCQHASYTTQEGAYRGSETLSPLLGFWAAHRPVLVRFNPESGDGFSVDYLDATLNRVGSRTFVKGTDYQVQADGTVEISTSSRCEGGGGPGLGCTRSHVRLAIDQTGSLAVIQSTGGAGIVGIVPVAGHSEYLSVFPKPDLSQGSLQQALAQCPEDQAAKRNALARAQQVTPTFAVGDVVVPYRHFDRTTQSLAAGPWPHLEGTKWRVDSITHMRIRMTLVAGEYEVSYPKKATHRAGEFATDFSSNNHYMAAKPYAGRLGQVFEEFRKDK